MRAIGQAGERPAAAEEEFRTGGIADRPVAGGLVELQQRQPLTYRHHIVVGDRIRLQLDIEGVGQRGVAARHRARHPHHLLGGPGLALTRHRRGGLRRKEDRSFLDGMRKNISDWRKAQTSNETSDVEPMKPQRLAAEIGKRLREDAIVSADSGTITAWWARHVPARSGQLHSVSGSLASMGCALPYAIAAQIAYPDRQCIAIVGDGGMAMLMAEFATCVKYALPVKVFVFRNNSLGQIKWEQLMFLGNPEYSCDLHPIDYAAFARACGGQGFREDRPQKIADVIEEALTTSGPVIVEAYVDPWEAPMFANLRQGQLKKLHQAIDRGEPDAEQILTRVREDQRAGFLA